MQSAEAPNGLMLLLFCFAGAAMMWLFAAAGAALSVGRDI
jgi:hypothetical protein